MNRRDYRNDRALRDFARKQSLGLGFVEHDLVDALPKLRILFRQEHHANSGVARAPGFAAVIGAVNASGGNCPW